MLSVWDRASLHRVTFQFSDRRCGTAVRVAFEYERVYRRSDGSLPGRATDQTEAVKQNFDSLATVWADDMGKRGFPLLASTIQEPLLSNRFVVRARGQLASRAFESAE